MRRMWGTMLAFAVLLHGQSADPGRFTAKLLQNRYSLSVRDGQFTGAGAQVLKSAIAQSRFVLLGETHGLAQTPQFWSGVCRAASPEGFRTMAVEEGPLAAEELERWSRGPGGAAQLAAFLKQYPDSIQIFNSAEEFGILEQCAGSVPAGNFRLWGLNQESLGAAGLILRRILDTRPTRESAGAIQELLRKEADASARALQTGRISDLFMLSADDHDLAAAAATLQKTGPPRARALLASLIESHEINRAWPADGGRRNRLIKERFASNYAKAAAAESSPPKVLLKFGQYHVYRGFNPMHEGGIGNYVAELAEGQGAKSLHICLMAVKSTQTIYPGIGRPARQRTFNLKDDPRSRYLDPMLANLLEAEWTLFDLRALRQAVREGVEVAPALADLVFGMDILVMVPEGTPLTRIR